MAQLSNWWKLRVRTVDDAGLKTLARELAGQANAFQPALLIGIRSGGYTVASLMAEHLPQAVLLPITCRRPSTQKKQDVSLLKTLLRNLPYAISDCLRIIEHIILTQKPKQPGVFSADPQELQAIETALRQRGGNTNILIADDAVDSGATLQAVYNAVRALAPSAPVKTAAITVTTGSPLLQPDFTLYRYVLCRFPWSLDFKR